MSEPTRASYRLIFKILNTSHAGRVLHRPEEYARIVKAFMRAGGSWVRVYQGSVQDIGLLKKLIRLAVKLKVLSPAGEW